MAIKSRNFVAALLLSILICFLPKSARADIDSLHEGFRLIACEQHLAPGNQLVHRFLREAQDGLGVSRSGLSRLLPREIQEGKHDELIGRIFATSNATIIRFSLLPLVRDRRAREALAQLALRKFRNDTNAFHASLRGGTGAVAANEAPRVFIAGAGFHGTSIARLISERAARIPLRDRRFAGPVVFEESSVPFNNFYRHLYRLNSPQVGNNVAFPPNQMPGGVFQLSDIYPEIFVGLQAHEVGQIGILNLFASGARVVLDTRVRALPRQHDLDFQRDHLEIELTQDGSVHSIELRSRGENRDAVAFTTGLGEPRAAVGFSPRSLGPERLFFNSVGVLQLNERRLQGSILFSNDWTRASFARPEVISRWLAAKPRTIVISGNRHSALVAAEVFTGAQHPLQAKGEPAVLVPPQTQIFLSGFDTSRGVDSFLASIQPGGNERVGVSAGLFPFRYGLHGLPEAISSGVLRGVGGRTSSIRRNASSRRLIVSLSNGDIIEADLVILAHGQDRERVPTLAAPSPGDIPLQLTPVLRQIPRLGDGDRAIATNLTQGWRDASPFFLVGPAANIPPHPGDLAASRTQSPDSFEYTNPYVEAVVPLLMNRAGVVLE